ncbi:MAG: helix-turn-helix transcriptional regulator [Oscillospiraceae bacterium]|nr:helix-turn-helix transcriptional regulator [Oscillospiraceae bacterium]MDD4368142.1 helix-turn-helix transcriptional regulator [Oscillospiraceae bacterium]
MILADKIIKLRKQNGWSQEDLAMKLSVSRQSVSKWESAAAVPDLNKIIRLGDIFSVSTDYLLKDELEDNPGRQTNGPDHPFLESEGQMPHPVSLEDAHAYLDLAHKSAPRLAVAVASCVFSPVPLLLLLGRSELAGAALSENQAAGIGVTLLLLIIAAAVTVMILLGSRLDKYAFLEKEVLAPQYGVAGLAESRRDRFETAHKLAIALGVALCIVSAVPLMLAAAFDAQDGTYIHLTALLLCLVAVAVGLFVWSGIRYDAYQKLLEEGDYTAQKKRENQKNEKLASIYWPLVTAIYLGVSFLTGRWGISWVIWPCAGVLYAAVIGIAALLRRG